MEVSIMEMATIFQHSKNLGIYTDDSPERLKAYCNHLSFCDKETVARAFKRHFAGGESKFPTAPQIKKLCQVVAREALIERQSRGVLTHGNGMSFRQFIESSAKRAELWRNKVLAIPDIRAKEKRKYQKRLKELTDKFDLLESDENTTQEMFTEILKEQEFCEYFLDLIKQSEEKQ